MSKRKPPTLSEGVVNALFLRLERDPRIRRILDEIEPARNGEGVPDLPIPRPGLHREGEGEKH